MSDEAARLRKLYLDLIETAITGLIYRDPPQQTKRWKTLSFAEDRRAIGRDLPSSAHSMIGTARMRNLRQLAETVIAEGVPGDFIETGVWRGGACIYLRAILAAHGLTDRTVWVADSFQGLPPPDAEKYPRDRGDRHHRNAALAISRAEVEENFRRYGLLDAQVRFLEGWFRDTLPGAPIGRLALLRLDGDMYESTWDALAALYDRVSPGGAVIVDDFGAVPACAEAVRDFLGERGETVEFTEIDWTGVWWRKA
ncbi:TylF/MycF family methyltransferase [Paralimibaculum aggregatum]|uniref:TylF/MycF family methyltransferase n=1 Tax=Paralimibaculum aggregatum TaxID=3036245 RepID=A0ABQ6LHV1_9RHOB|nr:TylF/MycF family methyltransferase [Limibaculum sp. NKW23]GMG82863.1 TylF/MycF family methyltransferase [Limibaculum sp. NKW23]